ncbi:MAG TPA: hypothetical protein VIE63_02375 [Ramlibacter sp.]
MQSRSALALVASIAALAGCASTAPLSFVEGVPWTKTDSTLFPVRVVSIDGHIEFSAPGKAIMISPGLRSLVLEAAPDEGAGRHIQKTYALPVQPCTHYYLGAKRTSALVSDWTLVVDAKEPVAGCDPKEELRKAGNID